MAEAVKSGDETLGIGGFCARSPLLPSGLACCRGVGLGSLGFDDYAVNRALDPIAVEVRLMLSDVNLAPIYPAVANMQRGSEIAGIPLTACCQREQVVDNLRITVRSE
jgi:hypothetical protein